MIYVVVKTFATLEEADRFAESVTENDVVGVFPLDEEPVGLPGHRVPAGFSSSGRRPAHPRLSQQRVSPPPAAPNLLYAPEPEYNDEPPPCNHFAYSEWWVGENKPNGRGQWMSVCDLCGANLGSPGHSVKVPPA